MYPGLLIRPSCPRVMIGAAKLLLILLINSLAAARDAPSQFQSDHQERTGGGKTQGGGGGGVAGNGQINITAQLGTHAYLPCRAKQLGNNKSVSWIRRRDAHILTVDRYTFIADDRFQSFLIESTGVWTLQVKYVQTRDAGSYECQISGSESERKLSSVVNLHVVVPHTEILGESDVYVLVGSRVALRCVVRDATLAPPAYVEWRRTNGAGGAAGGGGGAAPWVATVERAPDDTTIGVLRIESAEPEHSGNYTCHPSNLAPARVTLHVLDGEHPAAMQRDKNSAFLSTTSLSRTVMMSGIIALIKISIA